MKLTPLDIRHKEFRRAMRGYSDEDVDLFLDEVADEFERLFQDNIDARERLEHLEEQVRHYESLRDTLQKTLVSAQQQADETRANARKEAELILKDAEIKGRDLVSETYGEKQRVQQALTQLKQVEEDFRFKFRSLLEAHLNLLSEDEVSDDRRRFRGLVAGIESDARHDHAPVAAGASPGGPPMDRVPDVEAVPDPAPAPRIWEAETGEPAPTHAGKAPFAAAIETFGVETHGAETLATEPHGAEPFGAKPEPPSNGVPESEISAAPDGIDEEPDFTFPGPARRVVVDEAPEESRERAATRDPLFELEDELGSPEPAYTDLEPGDGRPGDREQRKDSSVRRFLFGRKETARSDDEEDFFSDPEDRDFHW